MVLNRMIKHFMKRYARRSLIFDIWGKVEFSEKTDKFEKAMRWGFTRAQSLIKDLQP